MDILSKALTVAPEPMDPGCRAGARTLQRSTDCVDRTSVGTETGEHLADPPRFDDVGVRRHLRKAWLLNP
jgi:hypothetical protein